MKTRVIVVASIALAAAGAAAWFATRGPSYRPVVASTALESWRAPWSAPDPPRSPDAMPRRWIVVGWDGASWDLALPLLTAGKLPHLAKLMQGGAYGAMYSFKPTWSPVLWTTVATGVPPSRHGILAWGRVEGGTTKRLFTNADRRVRALWNLMTDAHRPSLIVGYHNTYPADRIDGLMVSNYLYHEHLEDRMGIADDPKTAGTGLVYPAERLQEIVKIERQATASMPAALPRFATYGPEEAAAFEAPLARALRPEDDERIFFLKKAYLFDTMNGEVAEAEYPRLAPDLLMVHFQCIDLASHYFLYFHEPERFATMPWTAEQRQALDAQRRLYTGTVEAFYRFADDWLGRIDALRDAGTGLLLLSDHGFGPESNPRRTGDHVDAPPGIFVVSGPGVRPGRVAGGATLYDVMPTLAAALGLPVADDLPGRAQASWFTPQAWSALAVRRVPTYEAGGRYAPDIPSPDATERELLEQLRAIGYVT